MASTASPNRESSLTIDASWLLIARVLSFAFAVALPVFLTRHLDQTQFGVYKQAFLMVNSLLTIVPFGFGMSAMYFVPREPEKKSSIVLNILLFNLLAGAPVCLALAIRPSILRLIFGGPELLPYARYIGVIVLLWTIASGFEFIAIALTEMRAASTIIICIQLSRTAFVLTAAVFFGSVQALVTAAMIQGACQVVAYVIYLNARFPGFWRHFDGSMMRRQLSYALPLGAAGFLYVCQTDLHNYFVSNRFSPALFAVYSIGTAQLPLVYMLQEAATSVLIPRISLLQARGEHREVLMQMLRAIRKLAAAYLPIYFLMLVVGREFIAFLFTDRYASAWPVFVVNLTLLPVSMILFDPLYRAYANQRYFLIRMRIVLCAALIPLLWFATARFELVGAIATVVIILLTERVVTILRFRPIFKLTWSDLPLLADIGKLAIAAGLAALGTALVRARLLGHKPIFVLLVCGVIFGAIYLAGVLLLRIPSEDEKRFALARLMPMVPASLRPTP